MSLTEEPHCGDAPPPVRVEFSHDDGAPGHARRVTRQTLVGWGLRHLVDPVVLAVSELVTNAIRYGRPPLVLELRYQPGQLRLTVHDGNPSGPLTDRDGIDLNAESGRGIAIVGAVADQVVVEQIPNGGKVIHAVFATCPAHQP